MPDRPAPGRRPLIAGNWKMNLTHLEAIALTQKVVYTLTSAQTDAVEVVVLPPFISLRSVQTLIDGDQLPLRFGAQDLSPFDSGAYTGDIGGPMLAKLGCRYVLVGHSERRRYHGEDDQVVNSKLKAAVRNGLTPILCVGESQQVREAGGHLDWCHDQLTRAVDGVPADAVTSLVVAYEPLWAVGSGAVATPEDAQQMCAAIRADLAEAYGDGPAQAARVLYGGSVKAGNAGDLLARPDVDGALVGGASLDAQEFAGICAAVPLSR